MADTDHQNEPRSQPGEPADAPDDTAVAAPDAVEDEPVPAGLVPASAEEDAVGGPTPSASEEDDAYDLDALDDQVPATDPITRYLREIGRTALLSAKEEVDLAQAIERGKEARALLNDPEANLPQNDRWRLEQLREIGDEARQRLIQANLRL